MEGIALPKPPSVPKFVTFGSPVSAEKVVASPDMTNTFLLIAIAGGILIAYALSRVIALQRRIKDLESRPPVDEIVMRSLIRQEVGALVSSDPPTSIDTRKAEYVPAQNSPVFAQKAAKLDVKSTEPAKEVPRLEPVSSTPAPNVAEQMSEEESEEERLPTPPPTPKKKKRPSKAKKSVEVDLNNTE
jgi:hypothetical protein